MSEKHIYDMIIIGGGPAGYTAALYAGRAGLDALLLEKLSAGGQMALTHQIDNYPGFEDGIDGFTLAERMRRQAERFGIKSKYAEVTELELKTAVKAAVTTSGTFYAKTVVLAMGAGPRELGADGEAELIGRGVAYCASCDGMFYKGKTVAVVGGGDTAAADALLLSRIAKKVYLIHRRESLRAAKIYHLPIENAGNIEFLKNTVVTELLHGEKLTGLRLKNTVTEEERAVECDGVFISVGRKPETRLVENQLELENGYITAGESTKTDIPGVFAAGDIRTKPLRQVVTAVADGATAVHAAVDYLAENE